MTTESVDCFFNALEQNIESDVLISGVPEDLTSQYFPNHNRIVGKFTDCQIYPGEMMALRHTIIPTLMEEIDQLSRQRRQFDRRKDTSKLIPVLRYLSKKPKLWLMILGYLSGNISLKGIEKNLSEAYQMNFRCVIIPDPGFGMDLDLPEDYQRLSDYLSKTKRQDL
jgi:hypothetical protein